MTKMRSTPPKINMSSGKGTMFKGHFIFQPSNFQGIFVSFQGEYISETISEIDLDLRFETPVILCFAINKKHDKHVIWQESRN